MIPEDIVRFVLTSVPSIPYLEAALLLRRESAVDWSEAEVARALYIPERVASGLLKELVSAGIAKTSNERAGRFHYAPLDAPLATTLERLSELYRTDMIGITRLVHDATARNAHRFASAFNVRKES